MGRYLATMLETWRVAVVVNPLALHFRQATS